jgi:curved DNA-binding protein CbpA
MTDYFAVLRQPRRPWLDLEKLKEEYQRRTLAEHPDLQAEGRRNAPPTRDPSPPTLGFPTFAEVNEAYRVLNNHRMRLQHLLFLCGRSVLSNNEVPADLADRFMNIAALIREVDVSLKKRNGADNALSKALLEPGVAVLQNSTNEALAGVDKLQENAVQELQRLDEEWQSAPDNVMDQLAALAQRFAYFDRWMEQLRERQFQLSVR